MTKHLLTITGFLCIAIIAKTQNVGIGTSSPTEKLEVHKPVNSAIKISSANYGDTSRLILSNRDSTNAGTDFLISAIEEQSLLISTRSDLPGNNSDSLFVLKTNGRLGLGVKNPATRLDVNGGARLSGTSTLEFGGGVANKETNAGKIGYNTFSGDALDIVGAGNKTTDRKVYVFAEGGTYFQGPINASSTLQVNGNPGLAGQVLTSNGNASPSWTNAAFGNTTRFSFNLSQTTAGYNVDSLNFISTNYNLNPTQVFIAGGNATRLQINKTGLYHFSGAIDINYLNLPTAVESSAYLDYFINNKVYPIDMKVAQHVVGGGNNDYYCRLQFSFDVYITAGQTIKFEKHSYPYSGGYGSGNGYVNGYLVAD